MDLSLPLLRLFTFFKKAFHLSDEQAQEGVWAFDEVIKEQVRSHTEHQHEIVRKDTDTLRTDMDEKFAYFKNYIDEKFRSLTSELLKAIADNNAIQLNGSSCSGSDRLEQRLASRMLF
jgi:uncharacterized protein YaaR (DUF327 family)